MKSKILLAALFSTLLCTAQPTTRFNLIPLPKSVQSPTAGSFTVNPATAICTAEYGELAGYLNDHLKKVWRIDLEVTSAARDANRIVLRTAPGLPEEGYTLKITPEGIDIAARNRAGIFYGLQTLFQLMPASIYGSVPASAPARLQLPYVEIEDAPRYGYRGAMLDVSRTFFDKETVMRYIDWAARHKINKFHWHLTDDNGWRIEIKKYPLLTERGAWRGPGEALPAAYGSGNKRSGGYYSQDDIREVVRYAAFRNVEVIPEINLPGHSQAARAAYPEIFCETDLIVPSVNEEMRNVWCAGREENFEMLRDILAEVAGLFPSKMIHIGGDEVNFAYWRACPRCQALMKKRGLKTAQNLQSYFVQRLESIIDELGKEPAAWNEVIKGGNLRKNTVIYGWQDLKTNKEAIMKGLRTVVMPGSYAYIDMKQHAYDRGHTWAGMVDARRLYSLDPSLLAVPNDKKHLILGVEAALFSELLDRPERFIEYQAYPRLCALAEVGWSDKAQRDWDDFRRRLIDSHFDRLEAMDIRFRMFPAEVSYKQGKITAKAPTPETEIRYTDDYSEPGPQSKRYTGPIDDNRPERYLFRTFYKGGYGTALPPMARLVKTVTPRAKETYTLPLAEYTDRNGIWLLSVTPEEDDLMINQLVITGLPAPQYIIRNGQRANPFSTLRLYLNDNNRKGKLNITFSNNTDKPNPVVIALTPSPYIEPKTTVTSSLSATQRFPFSNVADYHRTSYTRTTAPCKEGDYVLYTFAEPTECHLIDVRTGIPNITRYIITQGRVEYSADGTTFREAALLDDSGSAVIYPEGPVKAVRIAIDGSNGEPLAAFQDLRIIPKLQ